MTLITGVSTVGEKGQLVIPRVVRRALDVKHRLSWTLDEDGELRISLARTDLMTLKGRIRSRGKSVPVEDMD